MQQHVALEYRGRREGRELAAPMAPVRMKCTGQEPQVWQDIPAFPARWLYGLYALSPGTGVLAPVARNARRKHRELGICFVLFGFFVFTVCFFFVCFLVF